MRQSSPDPNEQLLRQLLAAEKQQTDNHLLHALLVQDLPAPTHRPTIDPSEYIWWRRLSVFLLATILCLSLVIVWQTTSAVLTIRHNIQAMQIPNDTDVTSPTDAGMDTDRSRVAQQDQETFLDIPEQITLSDSDPITPLRSLPLSATNTLTNATEAVLVARHEKPVPAAAIDDPMTVLILGSDQRPTETYPARTDAIIVARIEPQEQRIALLSLPRDLLVPIANSYVYDRINTAYVYGEMYGSSGLNTARQTVSNVLDIPIDHVVLINFQGFIGAVDALGGIEINVERELYDPTYPTMDYGYTTVHFLPGVQHMDGKRALQYSRIRHMDSDFERIDRQQDILMAMLDRVREEQLLNQINQVADMTTALRDYIQTDVSMEQMMSLAWAFRTIDPTAVERYSLNVNMVSIGTVPGDPYALVALPGTLNYVVYQLMEGSPETQSSEEVQE